MADPVTILAFSGSTREDSLNTKLVSATANAARECGADVTLTDFLDLSMPLYNGDLEKASGLPENARRLKAMMIAHDALLIASPEYNGGMTAVLKNALDWASRREGDEAPLAAYQGKVAGLVAASPGRLGGARSLIALRQVLSSCGTLVIPQQFALGQASGAFDDNGDLKGSDHAAAVLGVANALVETARRQKS